MDVIKILIVDDDVKWAKQLNKFLDLEEDFTVVGKPVNKEEALNLIKSIEIDIVLMDINLTEDQTDGIGAALEILELKPSIKIIMLTGLNAPDIIYKSFTAGAVDYVLKEDYLDLPRRIRQIVFKKNLIEVVLNQFVQDREEEQIDTLTPALKEVFHCLEQGMTQVQIADKLHKSENTINKQVGEILERLNVSSTKDAIRKVKKKGL